MTTTSINQYPLEVQQRFGQAIHAVLQSLADPLPNNTRAAFESLIFDLIKMDEVCNIARTITNPSLLRASCLSVLRGYFLWNLAATRRAVIVGVAVGCATDLDPAIRVEAVQLLTQINNDLILGRLDEDDSVVLTVQAAQEDSDARVVDAANTAIEFWESTRTIQAEVDQRIADEMAYHHEVSGDIA